MTEAGPPNRNWDDGGTTRRALAVSLALHAVLVLLAVFGLPFLHSKPEPVTIIPVEMVGEDDLTAQEIDETPVEDAEETPPAEEALEDAPEPEPVQESLPDSQTLQPPEPPSLSESSAQENEIAAEAIPESEATATQPESEVAATAPEPEAQNADDIEAEPQEETEPETAEAETADEALEEAEAVEQEQEDRLTETIPPAPRAKPEETPDVAEEAEPEEEQVAQEQPEPEPEPEQETAEEEASESREDRLSSILRNVEEMESQSRQQSSPESEEQSEDEPRSLDDRRKSQQLAQAIQAQVARCWRVDAGAQRAEDLVVPIRVQLAPDGRLRQPPEIQDSARMNRDRYYRAAAENARRAVLECQPFDLPSEDYALWRDMILNFNPREMF